MTWGQLAVFVKGHFPGFPVERNLSIVKRLVKRYGVEVIGQAVEGAALLGWKDLRGLNGPDGVGLRWARTKYWATQNERGRWTPPQRLKGIFRELGA
jgi:hypothetical protein